MREKNAFKSSDVSDLEIMNESGKAYISKGSAASRLTSWQNT